MKTKTILSNIVKIFLPLILGTIIALSTKNDFNYLETLNRKIILPPIVFVIVWSILYVLMGIWYYFYEKDYKNDRITHAIYYLSLAVNLLFTPILFVNHNIIGAFIDVLVLLLLIVFLFCKSLLNEKKYAYLLLPYIIWLLLATTLMVDLLIRN